jgi:hypothetical protein
LQIVGHDDGLGKIAHGTPAPAAFIAQPEVGLFLHEAKLGLENRFRPLGNLSRFERPLQLQGHGQQA